jgi:succinate dehydrogenase/fumarate reductase cytochrome b subunit
MGIPAAISTLGVIVSFAIPQLWLGYGVLAALSQPAERVFVWVVLVALLFAGINGVTMFMIGKGSMRAVRTLHGAKPGIKPVWPASPFFRDESDCGTVRSSC